MEENRFSTYINREWKFIFGDVSGAHTSGYDDSTWYDVGIPHSFGIPYFMENEFYVGYGYYRKKLHIEKAWLSKKIFLEFGAVFQRAEIFINGILVGTHVGGYTSFVVDITEAAIEGENLLAVRVDNLWDAKVAPRAGEHVFQGGIYRDVKLLVQNKVHVAWYGTYITTSEVTEKKALVRIETEICNDSEEEKEVVVEQYVARVLCEESKESWQGVTPFASTPVSIKAHTTIITKQEIYVEDPLLWSPETPTLYDVITNVCVNGEIIDTYHTEFGIRTYTFDKEKGFSINGTPYKIIGANVHQDHAGWGDAVTHAGMQRDVALIKECGMNLIRGSHYPHHTEFATECDRQGVFFWSELCYWGVGGPSAEGYWHASAYPVRQEDKAPFEESCVATLKEMIRTNRNHPSIIVWSISNEPFFSEAEVMEEARELAKKLIAVCKSEDPSRTAAVGGVQRERFDQFGDLAGYNGDGASLYINPGHASFVSEYGSYISSRPGIYDPHFTDNTAEEFEWRSGKCLWCGFHHGSFLSNMGYMGMIDYARLPLKTWYWYRNHLRGIAPETDSVNKEVATITLTTDRESMSTDGTEDAYLVLTAYDKDGNRSNVPLTVTLRVIEGGARFPTGTSIQLSEENGLFTDGKGAIELRSYYAGKNTIVAESNLGHTSRVIIEATGVLSWEEKQTICEMQPAPFVIGAPAIGESADIGINRPVFVGRMESRESAAHVVDGRRETYWQPVTDDEWIMVDLEGEKKVTEIEITFVTEEKTSVEVAISKNKTDFDILFQETTKEKNVLLEIGAKVKPRYIRIAFYGKGKAVQSIQIRE